MFKPSPQSGALIVLSGTLAFVSVACSSINPTVRPSEPAMEKPLASPVGAGLEPSLAALPVTQPTQTGSDDTYERALDKAETAHTISQSAHSPEDWRRVSSRWQQAIALLKTVPAYSPYNAAAKTKISEYERYLAYAQAQVTHPTPHSTETVVATATAQTPVKAPSKKVKPLAPLPIVAPTAAPSATPPTTAPSAPPAKDPDSAPNSSPDAVPEAAPPAPETSVSSPSPTPITTNKRFFQSPIKRRQAGTPVIEVTFNGTQQFEMIVDTGASGTLITQRMGEALSLVPEEKAKARTANGAVVELPLSNVKSIEVGGFVVKDVVVAIAGPEVETGLLGHDFFGNYDVTIKQDVVEFRER